MREEPLTCPVRPPLIRRRPKTLTALSGCSSTSPAGRTRFSLRERREGGRYDRTVVATTLGAVAAALQGSAPANTASADRWRVYKAMRADGPRTLGVRRGPLPGGR